MVGNDNERGILTAGFNSFGSSTVYRSRSILSGHTTSDEIDCWPAMVSSTSSRSVSASGRSFLQASSPNIMLTGVCS